MESEIKFGISLPIGFSNTQDKDEFSKILGFSLKAEKEGFDMVSIADHVFIPYEALSILNILAVATEKIKVGTSVIDANRRSPGVLAHITSTVDSISGGRLVLGIGRGVWNEKTYDRPIERPVSRMREIIIVLRKFWTEERVNHTGFFFNFEDAAIAAKPVQKPHPPIWVAGFGPRMLEIVGELGDGFITQNMSPELFEGDLEVVRESARRHGRDPEQITGIFAAPMAIASEYYDALQCIEGTLRGSLFRRRGPPWRLAERLEHGRPWERKEDVPLEVIDKCCIFGTPDDCIEKIERYVDKGVSYLTALPLHPLGTESVELFSRKVIAYFKDN